MKRREQIKEDLLTIIVDQIGVEKNEILEDSNIRYDLGFDSLDDIEVIMEVEIKYNIFIPDEDVEILRVIKECIDYLDNRKDITV